MTTPTLETIAMGDASAAVAQKVIASVLKSNDADAPGRVYDALRAFVFLTLVERRGAADDLPAWAQLVRRTRSALATGNAKEAEWMRPLSDMVGDAIGFGESFRIDNVVRRAHVREILATLRDYEDAQGVGACPRTELQRRTQLRDANLSKVVGTLIHHGLVERHRDRQFRAYELTARGRKILERLPAAPSERDRQPDLALGVQESRPRLQAPAKGVRNRSGGGAETEAIRRAFDLAVIAPEKESFVSRAAPKTMSAARMRKQRMRPKRTRLTSARTARASRIRSRMEAEA